MIDPFDLWNSFQSAVNTFQGGWFRPQTDFIQACNDLSFKFWNQGRKEAEKSQFWKDNMAPFFKSKNYIVKVKKIYGHFDADKDYAGFSAARIIVHQRKCMPDFSVDEGKMSNDENFKSNVQLSDEYYDNVRQYDIDMIDNIKWGSVNKHKTKGPTMENPKIRQIDGGFEVAPRGVTVVVLDYWRQPKIATFAYVPSVGNEETGAGDNLIYDQDNSQPLEWPFNMRDEFLIGLGERYSIFTREEFMFAASQQAKKG